MIINNYLQKNYSPSFGDLVFNDPIAVAKAKKAIHDMPPEESDKVLQALDYIHTNSDELDMHCRIEDIRNDGIYGAMFDNTGKARYCCCLSAKWKEIVEKFSEKANDLLKYREEGDKNPEKTKHVSKELQEALTARFEEDQQLRAKHYKNKLLKAPETSEHHKKIDLNIDKALSNIFELTKEMEEMAKRRKDAVSDPEIVKKVDFELEEALSNMDKQVKKTKALVKYRKNMTKTEHDRKIDVELDKYKIEFTKGYDA